MNKETLLDQINENRYGDSKILCPLCDELYSIAEAENDKALMGEALYYKGEALYADNSEVAVECLNACLNLLSVEANTDLYARAYNTLGILAAHREDYNASINYYLECLKICESHGLNHVAGLSASNLGFLFQSLGAYEKAISYYETATNAFSVAGIQKSRYYEAALCTNIFSCLYYINDTSKMYDVLQKLRADKDCVEPVFSVPLYEGVYCSLTGDRAGMQRYITEAVRLCVDEKEKPDFIDVYQFLCEILHKNNFLDELGIVIEAVEKDIPSELFPRIRIDFVKYAMVYYEHMGQMKEYIEKSKEYVSLYEIITDRYYSTILESLDLHLYVDQLEHSEDQYKKAASTDKLTRLLNRAGFEKIANQMIDFAKVNKRLLAFFILDIDFFKQYNDYYGHVKGDECLMAVSNVISNISNDNVVCGRFGGDEFVIICQDIPLDTAKNIADSLVKNVQALEIKSEQSPVSDYVSVSVGGVVEIPTYDADLTVLVDAADKELYKAKKSGRNTFRVS